MLGVVQTAPGLPICHEVFDGNSADTKTLLPTFKTVLARFPSVADAPEEVAADLRKAIETGIAGLSIQDRTVGALYALPLAIGRIRAVGAAIDAIAPNIILAGRSEGFLIGNPGIGAAVGRRVAYAAATEVHDLDAMDVREQCPGRGPLRCVNQSRVARRATRCPVEAPSPQRPGPPAPAQAGRHPRQPARAHRP